jgi:hypothetical protein
MDLEQLIRKRQDELRGRPEDWIDRFGEWRRRQDWWVWAIIIGAIVAELAILAFGREANAKPAFCPWAQTCMTPRGETIKGVFRPWPKGDPREKRR